MGNIIRALFGKKTDDAPVRDVAALVAPYATPAIQVVVGDSPSLSHFGGAPNLPSSVRWPEKNGFKLTFLARISLTEVQHALPLSWLPQAGALLFFYDLDKQPWGFDPKDRGSFAVMQVPDLPAIERPMQPGADSTIPRRYVSFRQIDVIPSAESGFVESLKLTEPEWETIDVLSDIAYGGKTKHQISGAPYPIQGNHMDLESQLASNGVYCGDSEGYKSEQALQLKEGRANWRLLFQMDSDDDLGVMWGDGGMLYFWIEEREVLKGNFSNAWLILQCL
jgi:uncharacterized protein YwqG